MRLWNIESLGPEVDALVDGLQSGKSAPTVLQHLPAVAAKVERAAWESFTHEFQGAEFEEPCIALLRALYGEDAVEHTAGPSERGADAVCTYHDPLGLQHRAAVQIKMWNWDADATSPLRQIEHACSAFEGITAGVVLCTAERTTGDFDKELDAMQKRLRIPIKVILRRQLMQLFLAHMAVLLPQDDEGA